MESEEDFSDLDDLELDDEDLDDLELDDEMDLEEIEAQLRDLEDDDLGDLTEEELRQLEEEVGGLDSDEEQAALEETGNLFIGALKNRPKYAFLMENLEQELEEEEELRKQRVRNVIPKYMVNPFALPNRVDYEEIFDEIDPEEPDLKIWIIDGFEPVPIPLKNFGKFHSGDCYVLLYITEAFEGGIVINIHHWIGEQASVDKFGAAAFRAVELNMFMGGRCHIFREEESKESQTFLDYFDGSVEYLVGGTKESFHHVKPNMPKEHKPTLYELIPQSTGQLIMKRVAVHYESLDSSFNYILDAGKRIFIWNGFFSETKDRHKALAHAHTIRSNERGGHAVVIILTEGNMDEMLKYEEDIFWSYLNGRKTSPQVGDSPPTPTVMKRFMFGEEDEEEFDEAVLAVSVVGSWDNFYDPVPMVKGEDGWDLEIPLPPGTYQYQYKVATSSGVSHCCDYVRETKNIERGEVNIVTSVFDKDEYYSLWGTSSNEEGKLSLDEIDFDGRLERKLLHSDHAFILDCGTEVFVWIGRYCKPLEKQVALAIAKKIFIKYDREDYAMILGVYETAELTTFTSKFIYWDFLEDRSKRVGKKSKKRNLNSVRFTLGSMINVESRLRQQEAISEPMIDNGSGTVEVRLFSLQNGAAQTSNPQYTKGVFFNESCYIVLYKYDAQVRGKTVRKFLVYFWSGIKAKNADAVYAKFILEFIRMLMDRLGPYRLNYVRVLQDKEPKHFMRLFDGQIIVKHGSQEQYSKHFKENALFAVCISSHLVGYPRIHVTEVDLDSSSFLPVRCFILCTKEQIFIWVGEYCFPEEKDMAKNVCKAICKSKYQYSPSTNPIIVEEAENNHPNYSLFSYYISGDMNDVLSEKEGMGRLYAITKDDLLFEMKEIENYAQHDLLVYRQAVLLLHTRYKLFVWQGLDAVDSLLQESLRIASHWIKEVVLMDEKSTTPQEILLEYQGKESRHFKALFPAWQNGYIPNFNTPTEKQEQRMKSCCNDFVSQQKFEKQYNLLQDQIELLQTICSSQDYSKAEEKAVNPSAHIVKVSFDKELIEAGLKEKPKDPPVDKLARFKETVKPGEVFFHWKNPGALAVALRGSWNNWEQIPLVNFGSQGFATKIALDPGRFYYNYLVASSAGAEHCTLGEFPSTKIKVNEEEEPVNILRVYLCTHPSFLEKQRLLKEKEEEEKRKAEEEAKRELTAEEIEQRTREFKEEQRRMNEERLRKQLEERRKNRIRPSFAEEESPKVTEKETPLKDSLDLNLDDIRSTRRSKYSGSNSENTSSLSRKKSSSTIDEITQITPKISNSSSKSYREKRRAELGLSGSSPKEKETSSVPKSSSRANSLLDKLEVPSTRTRTSRYSRTSNVDTSVNKPKTTKDSTKDHTSRDYTSSSARRISNATSSPSKNVPSSSTKDPEKAKLERERKRRERRRALGLE